MSSRGRLAGDDMYDIWKRLRTWTAAHFPELADDLMPPATDRKLSTVDTVTD